MKSDFRVSDRDARDMQRSGGSVSTRLGDLDEAIRRNIAAHLGHGSAHGDDIVVEVHDGEVTLLGDVPHGLMKQQVEEFAATCPGVRRVHNKLNVLLVAAWPEPRGQGA